MFSELSFGSSEGEPADEIFDALDGGAFESLLVGGCGDDPLAEGLRGLGSDDFAFAAT